MKLLFDANLSPKLPHRLSDLFPGSVHVFDTGLARHTTDKVICDYAKVGSLCIVTPDRDFLTLAREKLCPQVIHLDRCGYKTAVIEEVIRRNALRIVEFNSSQQAILSLRLVD